MNQISPISFKDAVINASNILEKHKSKESSWFGKKVFLGYSKDTGWKVHELSFFDQFFRRLNLAYRDTHSQFIMKKLEDLTEEEARFIPDSQLEEKMPKLKAKLQEIYQNKVLNKQKLDVQPPTQEPKAPMPTDQTMAKETALAQGNLSPTDENEEAGNALDKETKAASPYATVEVDEELTQLKEQQPQEMNDRETENDESEEDDIYEDATDEGYEELLMQLKEQQTQGMNEQGNRE